VLGLIYALGDTSGAHFNPAVSLGFALRRLLTPRWLGLYWLAQLVGAVAGALVLRGLFGDDAGARVDTPHVGSLTALALETIFATILVVVVLGTADRYRVVGPDAALAVGSTIALCGLIRLPIEGASMNPARSLGPALAMPQTGDVWIYVAGPMLGASIAVLVTAYLHGGEAWRRGRSAGT
jgi:MIP family channel proteins